MEENRSNPRSVIHWRCALVLENNGGQETIHCRTHDVSITGVSVICHRNISAPRPVTVYLLIDPGDEHRPQSIVEVQGSIVNNVLSGQQGGFRLGIQFGKFAGDGKQLLQKYLPRELVQSVRMVKPPDAAPAAETTAAKDAASATETTPAEAETKPEENAVPTAAAAPTPDESSEQT